MSSVNLREKMQTSLSPAIWQVIELLSQISAETAPHPPLYLVGGFVRDLLLGQPLLDLDIVVVGNAIAFTQQVAARYGGAVDTHPRFGTATWHTTTPVWMAITQQQHTAPPLDSIDFVTARYEWYESPAALPSVKAGGLSADLGRRDITINALAIRLDGAFLGELTDLFGGQRDLDNSTIRILHNGSFIDDPTRIFRAIRYEQRFGFAIEPATLSLLAAGLDGIKLLSGERITHDLIRSLAEPQRARMLARMHELGVLEHIVPTLVWHEDWSIHVDQLTQAAALDPWQVVLTGDHYLLLWLSLNSAETQSATIKRLNLPNKINDELSAIAPLRHALAALPTNAKPSDIERAIRPHKRHTNALLVTRALAATPVKEWLDAYQSTWRHVQPMLDGNALKALGLQPGPHFRTILDQLLAARLDGAISTKDQEVELALAYNS